MSLDQQAIELWGGVECTVNRIGERFHDQLRRSEHLTRLSDIDRFAELGLKALRVPIIWERTTLSADAPPNFRDFDPMLERVQARGLRAIAGLCHHGSGPRFTNLLDPDFEQHLARYARSVAERYPWIHDYTPVNEPLTTARFSGLYGHWYPHGRDTASFLRALVHECRATIRAMAAIREVQPRARLVQTEDIGNISSTPRLAYQAEYENHRRFLSFDLLCGRVDRDHPLYQHLLDHGIGAHELAWIVEHARAPDLLGLNYYFTSDRHLDERLDANPAWSHGENGRDTYADIDCGRVPGVGLFGHRYILKLVWERYRLPVALTEVHAGCTREEQMRWLNEAWRGAHEAKAEGADVRAMTLWALLGSYDWNSLVRVEAGVYESGVFDLRAEGPRPTALATMVHSLATSGSYDHPLLGNDGWWKRAHPKRAPRTPARPILITGARGSLAQAFARACEARGIDYELLAREQLDIAERESVRSALAALQPWAVINAAGFSRVRAAEQSPDDCRRTNTEGPVVLAEECAGSALRLLTFSSDHVFDGAARRPYVESDSVRPLSVYGTTQAEAERRLLAMQTGAMIVRTSSLFGPHDRRTFVARALERVSRGQPAAVPFDGVVSPTYVPHLVDVCLDLLIDGASDLWHLTNVGAVSMPMLARRVAHAAKLNGELIEVEFPTDTIRPPYSVLGSERGSFMPTLEEALERYLRDSDFESAA